MIIKVVSISHRRPKQIGRKADNKTEANLHNALKQKKPSRLMLLNSPEIREKLHQTGLTLTLDVFTLELLPFRFLLTGLKKNPYSGVTDYQVCSPHSPIPDNGAPTPGCLTLSGVALLTFTWKKT